MDSLTPQERSERMSKVRCKNTAPELAVRSIVHRLGHRYRLHSRGLPGQPDLTFVKRRKIIFVHGCFWHRHENCKLARMPKSRLEFWGPKLEANRHRDVKTQESLKAAGWDVLVVWECELSDQAALTQMIKSYLGPRQ